MIKASNKPEEHPELLEIWEASVRATHDFLTEEKVLEIKQIIIEGKVFSHVDLYSFFDMEGVRMGFLGLSKEKIEMLFIHPDFRGKGVGQALTEFAVYEKNIKQVDVNEQNAQAVGFYKKMGFKVVGRNPLDAQGNPFPILEMKIEVE
ncbi:MAG: GNAT family N-acetyltransferase [Mongoliibacter sp.]|jgi:putative acetyltransferase|uniref:GNAT family N-acetyltransferase n=1 Tax=Mongoliibacter sp. TaxID=2022438 RepID=UPI0012F09529|nr:GNAT family N-acetyltransferase [Mongoliibacter sp.]TVP52160.1 MAG: GNAT family N-acetyltransferase [Mongoliibacter sp.]